MLAEVELRLDYGEEEAGGEVPLPALAALRADLEALSATFRASRLVAQGLGVALAGAPNAGKSRLFNLFLREERSIVSPEPGTTRDWIEAGLELGGLRLRLIDTAGLREAEGSVEAEGVARSRRLLDEADMVLYLVDASDPAAAGGRLPAEAEAFLAARSDALRLWNKVDLPGAGPAPEGFHALSAASGSGFPELVALLEARARGILEAADGPSRPASRGAGARIANERQKLLLDRSVSAIAEAEDALRAGLGLDAAALELREAAEALGGISGEITSPEILESIFSRFCVGK
jgi:tRNA modification GTPase